MTVRTSTSAYIMQGSRQLNSLVGLRLFDICTLEIQIKLLLFYLLTIVMQKINQH
jgi:hypothetical protein